MKQSYEVIGDRIPAGLTGAILADDYETVAGFSKWAKRPSIGADGC
jgi:hypothetical protein